MKKVTILFGEAHLSYSPTVIGLYDLLSPYFDVTIVAKSARHFNDKPLPDRKVVYIKEKANRVYNKISRAAADLLSLRRKDISLLRIKGLRHSFAHDLNFVRAYLEHENPDLIIAVDFKSLLITQLLKKRVEFLSLEIKENDKFRENCDLTNINTVIIQSRERYEHLFAGKGFRTFIVQNAPIYTASNNEGVRKGIVYCGTAWDAFGFYHILEYLKRSPAETLTVKGAILKADRDRIAFEYNDLVTSGRLIIDDDYTDNKDLVDYLQRFRIGVCFYNFEIGWVNTFNYHTAPSGKMFSYFAAGVPVIGVDVPGLGPVKEFDCGVLIGDLEPATIAKAVAEVESRFDHFSKNCLKAAEHYSFDKMSQPFLDYLLNRSN